MSVASSPLPSGERSRGAAERVRGLFVLKAQLPLTRRFAPTSPRWGEVKKAAPVWRREP